MNATIITITLGTEVDRNSKPIQTARARKAKRELLRMVSGVCGGATLTNGYGGWVSPNTGDLVCERVAIVTTCVFEPDTLSRVYEPILDAIRTVGRDLNQESVMVSVVSSQTTSVEFIDPWADN